MGQNWLTMETLVYYMTDGSALPVLAKTWEFSADFKSITFHLRQGVKFQDGTNFNADAVKYCYDSAKAAGIASTSNFKSVEIIDDNTIRLNLNTFSNSIWADLSNSALCIISPTQIREKGVDYARNHPCGTGPFILTEFVRDSKLTFDKNPNYWDTGKPYLDGIDLTIVKENMTQIALLKNGDIDLLGLQSGKDLYDLKQAGFQVYSWADGTDFLTFDTANAGNLFSDVRVRQAFEYAIDKKSLTDALGYGFMTPADQIPPSTHVYHDPNIVPRSYDVAKAKSLLAAAGYTNGLKTKFTMFSSFQNEALAVQQMMTKVGITVDLEIVDNLKFWNYSRTGWKDTILFQGFAFSPNFAYSMKTQFMPYTSINVSTKMPEGQKEMIDNALAATDPGIQKQLNYKLVEALWNDETVAPFLSDARGPVLQTWVHGYNYHFGADWNWWDPKGTWKDK